MPRPPRFIHPLRLVRKAAGNLSQAQFAKLIGVTAAAVQSFELGRLRVSPEMARRIAETVGVDPETITKRSHEPLDCWGDRYTEKSWRRFKARDSDASPHGERLRRSSAIGNFGLLKSKLDAVFWATVEKGKSPAFLIAINACIDDARQRFNVEGASEKLMCSGWLLEDEAKNFGIEKVQISAPWPEWPRYFD